MVQPVTPAGAPIAGNSGPSAKLVKSAQEFEAILLENWMEKMNRSFVSTDSEDPAHDTISSLGTQAVATALAARGGIGIASLLLRRLDHEPSAQNNAISKPGGKTNAGEA